MDGFIQGAAPIVALAVWGAYWLVDDPDRARHSMLRGFALRLYSLRWSVCALVALALAADAAGGLLRGGEPWSLAEAAFWLGAGAFSAWKGYRLWNVARWAVRPSARPNRA